MRRKRPLKALREQKVSKPVRQDFKSWRSIRDEAWNARYMSKSNRLYNSLPANLRPVAGVLLSIRTMQSEAVNARKKLHSLPEKSKEKRIILQYLETTLLHFPSDWSHSRSGAARALGEFRSKRAVKTLIKVLQDPESGVRWSATRSLGWIGDEAAFNPLLKVLQDDPRPVVRASAAVALGRVGDKRAVDALMTALKDPNHEVRWEAAATLGEIGDKRALKALIEARKDSKEIVRKYAQQAIDKIHAKF